MKQLYTIILCSFLSSIFLSSIVYAQETPVLPDLAPRQVEITGDLAISFPSLRRQPLIGFNPPPTVPGIPTSRRPYTDAYKQSGAELPPSPLVPPEPPAVSAFASREAHSGRVTVQAGRYLDRVLDADIELYVDDVQSVTASVSYFGTDGHDDTPTGGSTARDLFSSDIRWRRTAGPGVMGFEAGLTRDAWSLFGATPVSGALALPDPDRTVSALRVGSQWGSRPGADLPFHIHLKWTTAQVETDIFDPAVRQDPSTDRDESRLDGRFGVTVPVSSWTVGLKASGALSGLDESGSIALNTTRDADARLTLASPRGRRLELEVGAALLAFESDPQRLVSPSYSETFLVPSGRMTFWFNESTSFFAGSDPGLARHSSLSLLQNNPYVRDEPTVLPDLFSIRGFAGIMSTNRYTELEVRAGFDRAPSYGFYAEIPVPLNGYSAGYFDRRFDEADRFYIQSSVAVILSPTFHSGISATVQQTELSVTKGEIPFTSPVSVRPWIQGSSLGDRLDFYSELLFESARNRNTAGTVETDDFWKIEAQVRYHVRPGFSVTAGARHVLSEPDFWSGVPLEESAVHAGVGWRW